MAFTDRIRKRLGEIRKQKEHLMSGVGVTAGEIHLNEIPPEYDDLNEQEKELRRLLKRLENDN